jgi:hypothetical protein
MLPSFLRAAFLVDKENVMSDRKKNPARISNGDRIQRVETLLEEIASRLGKIETQFGGQTDLAREIETAGQNHSASMIALEEGSVVDLDAWERKMEDKYAVLCAKEKELKELEQNIYEDLEKLRAEIKQRDFVLIARDAELKSFKPGGASRPDAVDGLVSKRAADRKPDGWVSFLVDKGKKH